MSVLESQEGQELLRMVQLSIEAEQFLSSNLGGYLVEQLIEQRRAALNDLEDVDPFDNKAVRQCQDNARVPALCLQLIADCIQEGKQAERMLLEAEE